MDLYNLPIKSKREDISVRQRNSYPSEGKWLCSPFRGEFPDKIIKRRIEIAVHTIQNDSASFKREAIKEIGDQLYLFDNDL